MSGRPGEGGGETSKPGMEGGDPVSNAGMATKKDTTLRLHKDYTGLEPVDCRDILDTSNLTLAQIRELASS